MALKNTSKIEFKIGLDENNIPEEINWSADDGQVKNAEAKAMLISVWDNKKKETLKVDLWTKDMPLDEMQQFFHETLVSMATTFETATNDDKMAATMRDFCDYFAEKLELKS